MSKYKYLHLMPHISTVYNRQIIEMINDNPTFFNPEEHLFVIANENVYRDVQHYDNTILAQEIITQPDVINKLSKPAKFIFLHENKTIKLSTMLALNRETIEKIVWCVWGHDLYTSFKIKNLKSSIGNYVRRNISKHFYAIGIGFKYDEIAVRKYYKNMQIVSTPYGYIKDQRKNIDKIITCQPKHDYIKIMIGHSAYPFLKHKKILKKLKKYKNENIKISLVLAYGDKKYADKVIAYALKHFAEDKLEIIQKMNTHEDYLKYLQNVDICIFDFKHQAALGNFYILCYMNKKLFLNKKGILKIAANSEGMQTCSIEDIAKMNFQSFSRPFINNEKERQFGLQYIDDVNYLKNWSKTLTELNKTSKDE